MGTRMWGVEVGVLGEGGGREWQFLSPLSPFSLAHTPTNIYTPHPPHKHTQTHAHTHARTHARTHAHTHTHTHTHTHIYIYARAQARIG